MNEQPVFNGLGHISEQVHGSTAEHRQRFTNWMILTASLGFREGDGSSSDRFDFSYAATIELEANSSETACHGCLSGNCFQTLHFDGDASPSMLHRTWTRLLYSKIDHSKGATK